MSTTQVIARLLDADGHPVAGFQVECVLVGSPGAGWLADHTAEIITPASAGSDGTGLVTFTLTPQVEFAAGGSYYHVTGHGVDWSIVVPVSATPVQVRDCLVDPATLTPIPDVPPVPTVAAPQQLLVDEVVARQIADEALRADVSTRYAWDRGLGIPESDLADSVLGKLNFSQGTNVLADAVTIVVDATLGKHFKVTLGGNRTLGNPTGAFDGQELLFNIKQDGTGSRTLALGSKYRLPTAGVTVALSTAANKKDKLLVQYDTAADKFDVVLFQPGY